MPPTAGAAVSALESRATCSTSAARSPAPTARSCSPTPAPTSSGSPHPPATLSARGGSGALFEFLNTIEAVRSPATGRCSPPPPTCWSSTVRSRSTNCTRQMPRSSSSPSRRSASTARGRDRVATEFTLQAWCGSTGSRGLPEQPPLAAGGRIGEWLAGSFAAVAAVAAVRDARRSGRGAHIDVAMLDCMAVTMVSYPSVHTAMAGWPEESGPRAWWRSRPSSPPPTATSWSPRTAPSSTTISCVQIGRADVLETRPSSRNVSRAGFGVTSSRRWSTSTRGSVQPSRCSRTPSCSGFPAPRCTTARRSPRSIISSSAVCTCRRHRDVSYSRVSRTRSAGTSGARSRPRLPSASTPEPSPGRRATGARRGAGTAASARGDSGRRLHGVVGRARSNACAGGARCRRDQGGVGDPPRPHAVHRARDRRPPRSGGNGAACSTA